MKDWRYHPQYKLIPESLMEGLFRYLELGILPGSFLQGVLRGQPFHEVILRASPDSILASQALTLFLCNEAPARAWGSTRAVDDWVEGVRRGKSPGEL